MGFDTIEINLVSKRSAAAAAAGADAVDVAVTVAVAVVVAVVAVVAPISSDNLAQNGIHYHSSYKF